MANATDFKVKRGLVVSTTATILSTVNATSTTTGALIVSGGAAIAKDLLVTGTINALNSATTALVVRSNINMVSPDAASTITIRMLNSDAISFSGNSGQLFSITDSMTGTIFAVNDISGVPSIEVYDTGEVRLAETFGYVRIPNATSATSTTTGALRVDGGVGIGGDLYVGRTVFATTLTGTTINGNLTGTASTSTNLSGGAAGSIPYQTAAGRTSFIGIGSLGQVLQSNGTTATWVSTSSLIAGTAFTATTILNGTAGQLLYQSAPGVTAFAGPGTAGQLLVSAGTSAPVYTNTASIYVGAASSTVNLFGGSAGQFAYQTAAGTTGFISTGSMYVNRATIADNASQVNTVAQTANASYFPTFVDTNNASAASEIVYTTSSFAINPATGNVGIGTSAPVSSLMVQSSGTTLGGLSNIVSTIYDTTTSTGIRAGLGFGTTNGSTTFPVHGAIAASRETSVAADVTGGLAFFSRPSGGNLTERVRIDSAGNVGIGTSAPAFRLDLGVGSGAVALAQTDSMHRIVTNAQVVGTEYHYGAGTVYGFNYANATGYNVNAKANVPLILHTNNTERMRVDTAGNVGIATTAPASKLHVVGDARITGITTVTNTTAVSSTITGAFQVAGGVGIGGGLVVGGIVTATTFVGSFNGTVSTATSILTSAQPANATYYPTFVDANNATAAAELVHTTSSFVINPSTGNVGIGTSSPAGLLQVSNRFRVRNDGFVTWGQDVVTPSNSGFLSWDTGVATIGYNGTGALRFDTSASERMRIDSSGNVGIGITSPASKLHVSGDARITGITTVTNNTAASSTITGAFQVLGGAGIGGNLYIGGNEFVTGTLQVNSTNANTTTNNSNAFYTAGGAWIDKTLVVGGETTFKGSVVFQGTNTFVYSSSTVYTDNLISLHAPSGSTPGSHTWTVDDGKDIGFMFHYYKGADKDAFLGFANDTQYLEWYSDGTESGGVFTGTTYGTFKTGGIRLVGGASNSGNTTTGDLQVLGGVGIGGGLFVGGTVTATSFVGAFSGSITGAATQVNTVAQTANAVYYPTFVDSNNLSAVGESVYTTSSFVVNPSTGNVGIGTSSPASNLHIVTGSSGAGSIGKLSIGRIGTGPSSSIEAYREDGSYATSLILSTSVTGSDTNTERIRINSVGNVGIGTTSPVARLQSTGAAATTSPTLGSATGGSLYLTNTDNAYGLLAGVASNGNAWLQVQRTDASAIAYNLTLQPSGGNVGIGFTAPDQPLAFADSVTTKIQFNGSNANGYQMGLATAVNSGDAMMKFTAGETGAGEFGFYNTTNLRLLINNVGNVGIGTSTPNAKLETYSASTGSANIRLTKANSGSADQGSQELQFVNFGPANTARGSGVSLGKIYFGASQPTSGNIQDAGQISVLADGTQSGTVTPSAMVFYTAATNTNIERMRISSTGVVTISSGIASTNTATGALVIQGGVGINGALNAITKSFNIGHPTKPGMSLRYGSLEGPEFGVYVRGRLKGSNVIELPEYWSKLVNPDSITVNLTPVGSHQKLYVEEVVGAERIVVGNENLFGKTIDCFYTVYAERADIDPLVVEG